jgi:hypothetical protein
MLAHKQDVSIKVILRMEHNSPACLQNNSIYIYIYTDRQVTVRNDGLLCDYVLYFTHTQN